MYINRSSFLSSLVTNAVYYINFFCKELVGYLYNVNLLCVHNMHTLIILKVQPYFNLFGLFASLRLP